MAAITNTFVSTSSKTNREDLSDVVSLLTPADTPIYSMIEKGKTKATNPTWPIDTLRAPGSNVQTEGDEYIFDATVAPVRAGNFTQIVRDGFIISNTQNEIDDAGGQLTVGKQLTKSLKEIRKDVEFSILSNVGSVGGATRVSAGLPAWLTSNVNRGSGGANGGFNVGTGLVAPATNGTQRAFTRAMVDGVMQSAAVSGGNPTDLIVSPYVQSVFNTFVSDTNVIATRFDGNINDGAKLVSNVTTYQTSFGVVNLKMDKVMAAGGAAVARNIFAIDRDALEWKWFRPLREDRDIAKTGDAQKRMVIGEGCLAVLNEAACAVVSDVFGLSAAA